MQTMRIILILSILSCYLLSSAQEASCDTLTQNMKTVLHNFSKKKTEDNIKNYNLYKNGIPAECTTAQVYIRMMDSRINLDTGNIEFALQKLDDTYLIAKKSDNSTLIKYVLRLKTTIHSGANEYEKALETVNHALEFPCHRDSSYCFEEDIQLMINKGLYLSKLDRYDDAIRVYNKADSLSEKHNLKNPIYRVAINNSLGIISYSQTKNPEESVKYFKNAFNYCPEGHRGKLTFATNIASIYQKLGEVDSTRVYSNLVINATELPKLLVSPHLLLGMVERDSSNYTEAIVHLKKAIEYAEKSGLQNKMVTCRSELGLTYYLLKDYRKADTYLEAVNTVYKKNPPQKTALLQFEKYYYLNKIALENPKYSKSLDQYLINYDSLYGEQRQDKLNKLIYKYENKIVSDSLAAIKMTSDNQSLVLKNQRLSIFSLISALVASFCAIVFVFGRLKKSKVENKELVFQNNELQTLNAQLEQKTIALSAIPKVDTEIKEVSLKTKDKTYFIPTDNITYVQAEDDGTRVYYDDISKWTDVSLKNFHQDLGDISFVQIAKGIVVNVKHIAWINTNTLKMRAGAELKIGRVYKPKIKKVLES